MPQLEPPPTLILVEPDGLAPAAGLYEEVDTLGLPTGLRMRAWKDEQLPRSPSGHRWRLVPGDSDPKAAR